MNIIIEDYERLSDITDQMREAATAGEWNRLIALEKTCAHEVELIKPRDCVPSDAESRKQKLALIKKILADDKAIRERTDLWMQQLQNIIQSSHIEQRLHRTYLAQR